MDNKDKEVLFRELKIGTFGGKLSDEDGIAFDRALSVFREMLGQPGRGPDYVLAVYKLVDELSAEYLATHTVSCHKGCGACCCQLVCCSKLEMELIVEYLSKLYKPIRRQIQLNARKQSEKFDKLVRKAGIERESDGMRLRQLYLGTACPYLSKSQRCLIYPVRPIDCRIARTKGVCYLGPPEKAPKEEPKSVKLFFDQVACNLITDEDIKVSGNPRLTPLVAWPIMREFSNYF